MKYKDLESSYTVLEEQYFDAPDAKFEVKNCLWLILFELSISNRGRALVDWNWWEIANWKLHN